MTAALVIDARIKPHHAPPLIEDPEVTGKVDALGGPRRSAGRHFSNGDGSEGLSPIPCTSMMASVRVSVPTI